MAISISYLPIWAGRPISGVSISRVRRYLRIILTYQRIILTYYTHVYILDRRIIRIYTYVLYSRILHYTYVLYLRIDTLTYKPGDPYLYRSYFVSPYIGRICIADIFGLPYWRGLGGLDTDNIGKKCIYYLYFICIYSDYGNIDCICNADIAKVKISAISVSRKKTDMSKSLLSILGLSYLF